MTYRSHENVGETAQALFHNYVVAEDARNKASALMLQRVDHPRRRNIAASCLVLPVLAPLTLVGGVLFGPAGVMAGAAVIAGIQTGPTVMKRAVETNTRLQEARHEAKSHFWQHHEEYFHDAIVEAREAGIEIDFSCVVANWVEPKEVYYEKRRAERLADYQIDATRTGEYFMVNGILPGIEEARAGGLDISCSGDMAYEVRVAQNAEA